MINMIFEPVIIFFTNHAKFIMGVIFNLALIWAFCKIIDIFNKNVEIRLKKKHSDSPLLNLLPILNKICKGLVIFVLLADFLQSYGYNVTSLIAGFGITGLAVGFAAKEAIGNIFGSVGLLADRVYKIGDYISFNGYEGTVEDINLRSTTIRNQMGFAVNVPNNLIANEEITNITQATKRRIDISVDIEYGTSNEKIDKACEILKEIAQNDSRIFENPVVFIDNMAPSSIQVRLVAFSKYTAWADYVIIKGDVLKEIIHKYRAEGIEFAFPSTSIYMAKDENQNYCTR